jgi:hypothetical protein
MKAFFRAHAAHSGGGLVSHFDVAGANACNMP